MNRKVLKDYEDVKKSVDTQIVFRLKVRVG